MKMGFSLVKVSTLFGTSRNCTALHCTALHLHSAALHCTAPALHSAELHSCACWCAFSIILEANSKYCTVEPHKCILIRGRKRERERYIYIYRERDYTERESFHYIEWAAYASYFSLVVAGISSFFVVVVVVAAVVVVAVKVGTCAFSMGMGNMDAAASGLNAIKSCYNSFKEDKEQVEKTSKC